MKRLDEQGRLRHYRELMEEARSRFDVINAMLENRSNLDSRFVREICYLQFRYLCEIIALACLVAQGSFTKRLLDTYEADKIINELHGLNPHLYPQPVRVAQVGNHTTVTGVSEQIRFLQRDDLPKLWGRCGDILHISPLTKTLKPRPVSDPNLSDVRESFGLITALLNEHLLVLAENKKVLVVNMYAPYFEGRPAVHLISFQFNSQPSL